MIYSQLLNLKCNGLSNTNKILNDEIKIEFKNKKILKKKEIFYI